MQNPTQFGRAPDHTENRSSTIQRQQLHRALARRLDDKVNNYERAAARLELRGELDAAKALTDSAQKLRSLRGEG